MRQIAQPYLPQLMSRLWVLHNMEFQQQKITYQDTPRLSVSVAVFKQQANQRFFSTKSSLFLEVLVVLCFNQLLLHLLQLFNTLTLVLQQWLQLTKIPTLLIPQLLVVRSAHAY